MKFRADAKDIKIFVGFCFLLLYLCAIMVLNAHTLATTGTFYGLLPFEAFTLEYLPTTLILFFLLDKTILMEYNKSVLNIILFQ